MLIYATLTFSCHHLFLEFAQDKPALSPCQEEQKSSEELAFVLLIIGETE